MTKALDLLRPWIRRQFGDEVPDPLARLEACRAVVPGRLPDDDAETLVQLGRATGLKDVMIDARGTPPPTIPGMFEHLDAAATLDVLHGLEVGHMNVFAEWHLLNDRMPPGLVPIGDDVCGNQICIDVSEAGNRRGVVHQRVAVLPGGDQRARLRRVANDHNRISVTGTWVAAILLWCLLAFDVAHAQCPPAAVGIPRPFVMVVVFGRAVSESWVMSASQTEAVMVCHLSRSSQVGDHSSCRYGTLSRESDDRLHAMASDLVASFVPPKPHQAVPPSDNRQSAMHVFVCGRPDSDSFSWYSGSQIETDPAVKQLKDFMVQTTRRVGGEQFVPRF